MNMESKEHTCCFFGHRKIVVTEELMDRLKKAIEELITNEKIDTFLFGSKSDFDTLCLETVSALRKKYSHIKRVYVRAEFPYIDEPYRSYLLKKYEYTYYPEQIIHAGRAVYVKRNYEMIDHSSYCIIYYDETYIPPNRKTAKKDLSDYQPNSGTKLAYDYAVKKNLKILNMSD